MAIYRIILLTCVFVTGVFYARYVLGHQQRTMNRLIQTKIVKNMDEVSLLHSSGYRRENSHLFQMPIDAVEWSRPGLQEPEDSDSVTLGQDLDFVREHIKQTVDWTKVEYYFLASDKDESDVLWSAVVIKVPSQFVWIVLRIF